jgi:putative transposase
VSLMSDNACQPTAQAFMAACSTLGLHQAFTSDNNPKGNADTERVMRTLKAECLWLQEWASPFDLVRALATWIDTDNTRYLHSALRFRTPMRVEMAYHNSHSTPFVAA